MTLIDGSLPAFLARLQALPDPGARLVLFGAAVNEAGGTWLSDTASGHGTHLVELSLFAVVGRGATAHEALADWTDAAHRQAAIRARIAGAEAMVARPAPDATRDDLDEACRTVLTQSCDTAAIAAATRLRGLIGAGMIQ